MREHLNGTFDLELDYGTYPNCRFTVDRKDNGDIRTVRIINDEESVATVTIPMQLPRGLLAIKSFSENCGMLREMKSLGLVTKVVGYEPCAYTTAPVCRYNDDILQRFGS